MHANDIRSGSGRLQGLALLIFVAGRCLVPMDETDLFFNVRLGELVLETHDVTTQNLLSFTHPEARDINLAWVFQLLLALVHRLGGIPGTVLLKTAFVVGTTWILWRVALRRGARPTVAALVLALTAWAAEPRFVERPHLVTFLGLASMLLALERAEQGKTRALWALWPAGLVWANANSCFFLAPSVLVLYGIGSFLDGRRPDGRRALLLAGLLSPLILATPSGIGALTYIANHWRIPHLRPLQEYRVAEWPLDGPFFFVAAAVLLGAAAGLKWRHLLPCLVLGLLGARRIRFVAEFSLLAGPTAAAGLTTWAERLGKRASRRFGGEVPTTWTIAEPVCAALLLLSLTVLPRVEQHRAGQGWLDLGEESGLVPHAAVDFVSRHGLRERMYNDLEVGSYLTWDGWPRWRVFQDPRINGYPEELHAVLRRDDLNRDEWQHLLDGFGVTSALITYPGVNPRAALFDPNAWAVIYRDAEALVFVRRDVPRWSTLVAALELPLDFVFERTAGVRARPLARQPAGSRVPACSWQHRLADAWLELGQPEHAWRALGQALPGELEEGDVPNESRPCLSGEEQSVARRSAGLLALRLGHDAAAARLLGTAKDPEARLAWALALIATAEPNRALQVLEDPSLDQSSPDVLLARAAALAQQGETERAASHLKRLLRQSPEAPAAAAARAYLERLKRR